MHRKVLFSFFLLAVILPAALIAQRFDGTLRGAVTDASGAVLPDAKVTAKNNGNGAVSSTVTSSAGVYALPSLLAGEYTVTIEAKGFNVYKRESVQVNAAQTVEVNAALSVAGVSTVVEVRAGAEAVQTGSSQLSGTFESRPAAELPTVFSANGFGSVQNLVVYLPNTTSQLGGTSGNGGSVGGLRGRQNSFTIDGSSNNDQNTSVSSIEVIQDAVSEFNVATNHFSAEYGSAAGGQFNVVTRTGTNEVHGGVWWYGSNRNFNASSSQEQQLIASGAQTDKSRFDYNRLGGRVGGPIRKDKLFLFGSYEINVSGNQPAAPSEIVPTAAGFSTLNTITANPTIKGYLSQFPVAPVANEGTVPVTVAGKSYQIPVGDVIAVSPSYLNEQQYIINADYNRERQQMRFRYIKDRIRAPLLGDFPQVQFNSLSPVDNRRFSFNDVYNLNARTVNDFKFTYGRLNTTSPLEGVAATYPNIIIGELGASVGPASNLPQYRITNWYQLADSVSYARGKHTYKAGAEYRWNTSPSVFLSFQRGYYGYQTLNGLINDIVPDLSGLVFKAIGDGSFASNAKSVSWFVQDDLKWTPRLTLNLGLRYEFFGQPKDANANLLNAVSNCASCGIIFHKPNDDFNNFAPRVGFAWDPAGNGKWSVRGGAGIGYDAPPYNFDTNGAPPQKQATLTPVTACSGTFSVAPSWCTTGANFFASGAMNQTFVPPSTAAAARAVTANIMPDGTSPKVFNWTLSIEREIMRDTVLEVRYLGTRAVELPIQYQRNAISAFALGAQPLPTYIRQSDIPATVAATAPTLTAFLNARGQRFGAQGFQGVLTDFELGGTSRYHGAAIEVNRRMSKGLQFRANWTFSRALDNSTNDLNTSRVNPRRPEDTDNLRNEWGRSSLDVHNKVALTWIYDVPRVDNLGSAVRLVTRDWHWSGTYLFQGGQPITVQSGVDSNGNLDSAGDRAIVNPAGVARTGSGVTRVCRNATTGATTVDSACPSARTVGYVANNPNARYIQAQAGARTNAGRNTENSEPINVWNMTFFRTFAVKERIRLQFRADMYDIFNQQNYAFAPASIFGVTTNAKSTSYAVVNSPLFLNASQFDSGSRIIQFGLKVTF